MKRHGNQPQLNRIPGQQFELKAEMKKTETLPGGEDCVCDIQGLFWENPETSEYDTTTIIIDIGTPPS